jgi:hypothetical protein
MLAWPLLLLSLVDERQAPEPTLEERLKHMETRLADLERAGLLLARRPNSISSG